MSRNQQNRNKTMKDITVNSHNLDDRAFIDEPLELDSKKPHFGKYSIVIGYLLTFIGGIGIILPEFFAIEAMILIAGLLMIGSLSWMVQAYKYKLYGKAEWLKPLILFITAALMLFYPLNSMSVISLLLITYLLVDAIGSFIFAYLVRPLAGSELMIFNGLISIVLATLFFVSWPESSLTVVGLYIAISLFIDGCALLYMSLKQTKVINQE